MATGDLLVIWADYKSGGSQDSKSHRGVHEGFWVIFSELWEEDGHTSLDNDFLDVKTKI